MKPRTGTPSSRTFRVFVSSLADDTLKVCDSETCESVALDPLIVENQERTRIAETLSFVPHVRGPAPRRLAPIEESNVLRPSNAGVGQSLAKEQPGLVRHQTSGF